MDLIINDLFLHIGKVHSPYTLIINLQRAVNDIIAIILKGLGKSDISRAVDQDIVTLRTENIHGTYNSAKYSVFIADRIPCEPLYLVSCFMPLNDGIKILIGRRKITKQRMPGSLDDSLRNGWNRRKIHISHPHGYDIKSILWQFRSKSGIDSQTINRKSVFSFSVYFRNKIVFHINLHSAAV